MPVFNVASFLPATLASIRAQTFKDWELIAVDDASTDGSMAILSEFAQSEPRVRLLQNLANGGEVVSRNRAIAAAKGRYCAVMDADDIARPERLAAQVEFLQKNQGYVLVSSLAAEMDADGQRTGKIRGHSRCSTDIWWDEMTTSAAAHVHPTVMFRREVFAANGWFYDRSFEPAADKELWTRVEMAASTFIMPRVLLDYRVHHASLSQSKRQVQAENALRAVLNMIEIATRERAELAAVKAMLAMHSGPDSATGFSYKVALLQKLKHSGKFEPGTIERLQAREYIRAFFLFGFRPSAIQRANSVWAGNVRLGPVFHSLAELLLRRIRAFRSLYAF